MKYIILHFAMPILFIVLIIQSIFFHKEPTNSDLLVFIVMYGGYTKLENK